MIFDKRELELIFEAVQEYKSNHMGMYSQLDPVLECDGILYRIQSFLRKEKTEVDYDIRKGN